MFLEQLRQAYDHGELNFYGKHAVPEDPEAFERYISPSQKIDWVVYAKKPFSRPEHVVQYLSRYTHPVAIANSGLVHADDRTVTFKWKDYRIKVERRYKSMTIQPTNLFVVFCYLFYQRVFIVSATTPCYRVR
ncbi:hypothetical protein AB833_03255 [Chromatiales bacterium (ex Bugula neritina AB1)]|nr:hypothetical protein AB833_03255 [Chromatiales bacterium (ex Bugula neritina AB1)]